MGALLAVRPIPRRDRLVHPLQKNPCSIEYYIFRQKSEASEAILNCGRGGGGGAAWVLSLSLSGGFTPCRHLRPSSGREHTIVCIT